MAGKAYRKLVETHQLHTTPSTHREHSPSPMPAKKKLNGPTQKQLRKKTLNGPTQKQLKKKTQKQLRKKMLNGPTQKQLKKKTQKQLRKKMLNGPTRKQLRNKYMPTLPSRWRWTAHKVAVVILWRHRHLKKLKLKKKAKEDAKEEDLQNVVLLYDGDGSGGRVFFEGYLQRKFRPRKPSRFFFEHQARDSAEASKNTTSGPSSEDH